MKKSLFAYALVLVSSGVAPKAFAADVQFADEKEKVASQTRQNAQNLVQRIHKNKGTATYLSAEAADRVAKVHAELGASPAVNIPMVLSEADVKAYKKMFRLQRQRQRSQVGAMVPQLENRVLMGHLIAVRLLHPNTRSSYSDLHKWLANYNDQSPAVDIYKLANLRRPKGSNMWHKKPAVMSVSLAKYRDPDSVSSGKVKNTEARRKMLRTLKYYRQKQYYTKAMNILKTSKAYRTLGESTWAQVSLKLAQHMMMDGYYDKSLKVSTGVLRQTEMRQPQARWIAGFSAYKSKSYRVSAKHLRELAYSVPHNSKYFAQSAYWAAKSYEKIGDNGLATVFFQLATKDDLSFYGQLAGAKIGKAAEFDWSAPVIKSSDAEFLFNDPVVKRVIALAQIGEYGLAQEELKLMHKRVPYDMDESLLALSMSLNLPNTSMTLARNLQERGLLYVGGMYPDTAWAPRDGFNGTKALVHAVMRQESAFKPGVKSRAGARGLMQLMPATARYIRSKQNRPAYSKDALTVPSVNLMLGQDYLEYLTERVNGNLVHMIASYNAGPGNVDKWHEQRIGDEDPIEFIESIPFSETRKYVKRVMANLWMYNARYGQKSNDLIALANNTWPKAEHAIVRLSLRSE